MKKFVFIIIVLIANFANAQQILNLNKNFRSSIIPSAAGIDEQLILSSDINYSALGTHKNNSSIIGFDKKYELNIATSSYVKISNWDLWSDYSFMNSIVTRIKLSRKSYMQLAITPEIQWLSSNSIDPYRETYNDPTFLDNQEQNQVLTNISTGITFQSPFFFLDLAALRLISMPIGTEGIYKQSPYFLINTGFDLPIGENFECKPSTLFEFISKPFLYSIDAGTAFWYKERVGVSYDAILTTNEFKDGLSHRLSLNIRSLDRLQMNFTYMFGNSLLYQKSQGTYQIGLKYDLKKSISSNPQKKGE